MLHDREEGRDYKNPPTVNPTSPLVIDPGNLIDLDAAATEAGTEPAEVIAGAVQELREADQHAADLVDEAHERDREAEADRVVEAYEHAARRREETREHTPDVTVKTAELYGRIADVLGDTMIFAERLIFILRDSAETDPNLRHSLAVNARDMFTIANDLSQALGRIRPEMGVDHV